MYPSELIYLDYEIFGTNLRYFGVGYYGDKPPNLTSSIITQPSKP